MSVLSDRWIRETALNEGMIEPFVERQTRGGCTDRDCAAAERGFRAHEFGHAKSLLEKVVEPARGMPGTERRGIGVLHLSEDLRFPKHHRIQSRGHAEQMPHRLVIR